LGGVNFFKKTLDSFINSCESLRVNLNYKEIAILRYLENGRKKSYEVQYEIDVYDWESVNKKGLTDWGFINAEKQYGYTITFAGRMALAASKGISQ
jgi:hypothetical protein